MIGTVREVLHRRELLYMLTWREITIKYKQSVMGLLWAVLMPLAIVGAGILIRYAFAYVAREPFALDAVASVSVRAIPWAFVVAGIRFATGSLIGNSSLITKIYMPREVFPIAAILSQLVDLAVASVVLGVVLAVARIGASVHLLWVPVLLAILVALVTGLGIFLSAASLFFRDVKYLVEVVLTFAIFFTPVFYDAAMLGEWARYVMLNPVAPVLEGLAAAIVRHESPSLSWVGYSAAGSALVLWLALVFFDRVEPYFAESI